MDYTMVVIYLIIAYLTGILIGFSCGKNLANYLWRRASGLDCRIRYNNDKVYEVHEITDDNYFYFHKVYSAYSPSLVYYKYPECNVTSFVVKRKKDSNYYRNAFLGSKVKFNYLNHINFTYRIIDVSELDKKKDIITVIEENEYQKAITKGESE